MVTDLPAAASTQERHWPMAVLLGAAFLTLLVLSALAAAFFVSHWSAEADAAHAETELAARAARDAAAVRALLDEQQHLLALVAAQPQWRSALTEPDAGAQVALSIRRAWADPPDIAWVNEGGRVVVAAGDLRAGDDVGGRRWFDEAARGALLSDEQANAQTALRAVQPLHDAGGHTAGVLMTSISCDAIAQRLSPDDTPMRALWALVGRDGQTRCAQPGFPSALLPRSPPAGSEWIESAGVPAVLMAGQRVLGSAAVNQLGLRVVQAQSEALALPHAQRRAARAWLGGTLGALVALPLLLWLVQRIARPLRELAGAFDQARQRFDYSPQRIPVQGTRESVVLGQAARAMLQQIAATQAVADDSTTGYRELFELHPLPMWVVDEETLRFLEVNAAALRKYGWRRDDLLAMTVLDIRPPEAREAVAAAIVDMRSQEHHAVVWQHRLRSGELIDVEVATRQLRWGGRPARIAVVMDVTSQRRASVELHRQRRDLSQLTHQLMSAEERERRELAQVLHDRFAPTLYGAKLSLEALRARSAAQTDADALRHEVAQVVGPLVQALDVSIADTRGLMSELRPPLLVEHGLAAALAHEVQRHARGAAAVQVLFTGADTSGGAAVRHDNALEYALFMIAREALHNALRHAQARRVTVDLDATADRIRLAVRDDGCGFDSNAPPPAGHLGLVGMQERARWIGLRLSIVSVFGEGTTVGVEWRRP
jgi:PAS domain S-box-containing protein